MIRKSPTLLVVVLATACAGEPKCQGPSRAVTPARDVRAPAVSLAGVKLDATAEQVRAVCQGTFQIQGTRAICRSTADVEVRFDGFGHAKEITAHYTAETEAQVRLIQTVVAEITSALDQTSPGELAWCRSAETCDGVRDAAWPFEGGEIRLRSEQRENALELRLSHSHGDMTERVIYGLPVCAP